MLHLHDTATGTVRAIEPRTPGRVSMYVCGPTVDNLPHIGHGRFNLTYDILRRYLLFNGLEVDYVSNVTDIDDKIITRAGREGRSEEKVVEQFEGAWFEAMDGLGVLRPTSTPHATAYVEDMVRLVADLVGRGVAYETSDGVYLNVEQVPGYGLLARQSLDSLRSGARVESTEEKRSPLDFALWKKAKPLEPTWESPWGPGRPGWHTECVVMSLDLLGEGFDLHGGGIDLIFPHHENERAQAVAQGREFARYWVHNGWVTVDGTKMSKSLGNFTTLPDFLAHHDARAYRLLVLRARYRSPIEVTPETVADAEKGLERLDTLARRFSVGGLCRAPRPATWWRGHRRPPGSTRTPWRPSGPAWTMTSIRPWHWPGSSTSSRPPTRAPTRATWNGARTSPGPPRRWPPPWDCRSVMTQPSSTRRRPAWWPSVMWPGAPGSSSGPTRCATSSPPGAGPSRTPRTGRPSAADGCGRAPVGVSHPH